MALDYQLQQTGPEVQERLDEVPITRADLNQEISDRGAADTTLQQNINAEAQARETADAALQENIDAEETRATDAEQTNADAIAAEVTRAQNKEAELADSVNQEKQARINVAATLQDNIDAEANRAQTAEQTNASALEALQTLIPASASAQNKLVDKEFMNSSIATATATFRGTYNLITDLDLTIAATHTAIAIKLGTAVLEKDKNDYVFVQIPASAQAPTEIAKIERYKFDGSVFVFEYELNNSSFTTEQWNALNSGITSGLVEKLLALPTNSDLNTLLSGKQDTINDLQEIREGAAAGASSYQLPDTGIPATDLSEGVQESLEAADNAAPDVFGPYANVAAAHAALLAKGLNTIGRTVGIIAPSNMVVEYWYQGGTAQDNLVLKQSEVAQVKSINNIPLSGTGNIEVVQADFEDLANDKGTLKLADKAYVPNDFSGMGRVYLRKNMINASLHFADIISDLPSTETETLYGSCDDIVYETTNNRFLAVKHTSEGEKYYPNYQFTDSEVYSNPDNKHIYVCDANAKLYTYENGALEETTTLMDKNVLTQDMINKPNTIYIIQYDYDIVDMVNDTTTNNLTIGGEYYSYKAITIEDNQTYRALNDCVFIDYRHNSLIGSVLVTGENESQDFAIAKKSSAALGVPVSYYKPEGTINVPANCVLQFDGGSLKDGELVGSNTSIIATNKVIFKGVALSGAFNVSNVYHYWFDGYSDDTELLRSMFNMGLVGVNACTVELEPSRTYNVYHTVAGNPYLFSIYEFTNSQNKTIIGNEAVINDLRTRAEIWGSAPTGDGKSDATIKFCNSNNISILGLNYQNLNEDHGFDYDVNLGYVGYTFLLFLDNADNIHVNVGVNGARYGVEYGHYSLYHRCGMKGITNSTIIVNAQKTGYPVCIDYGDNLNIKVNSDVHHRAAYLGGISNSKVIAKVKSPHIAPYHVLITDSRYSDTQDVPYYKAYYNLDVSVDDYTEIQPQIQTSNVYLQIYGESNFANRTVPYLISNINIRSISHYAKTSCFDMRTYIYSASVNDRICNVNAVTKTVGSSTIPFRISANSSYMMYENTTITDEHSLMFLDNDNSVDGKILFKNCKDSVLNVKGNCWHFEDCNGINLTGDTDNPGAVTIKNCVLGGYAPTRCKVFDASGLIGIGSIRPNLSNYNIGVSFFDNASTPKVIYWTGSEWIDATGATV